MSSGERRPSATRSLLSLLVSVDEEYVLAGSVPEAGVCLGHQNMLVSAVSIEAGSSIGRNDPPVPALIVAPLLATGFRLADGLELSSSSRHSHGKKPTANDRAAERPHGATSCARGDVFPCTVEPRGHLAEMMPRDADAGEGPLRGRAVGGRGGMIRMDDGSLIPSRYC